MSRKYFSKKYLKILSLNSLLETLNDISETSHSLIIHTANGLYIGKLKKQVDYEDLKLQKNDDILTMFNKVYLSSLEQHESKEHAEKVTEIAENSISIELENVEYISGNFRINMPFVEIFIDQIVGFSLGSID